MIRMAGANDVERLKGIYKLCYFESKEFVDMYFEKRFDNSTFFCDSVDGEIVAFINIILMKVNRNKVPVDTFFIECAATLPDFREQGIMTNLTRRVFEYAREQGVCLISMLPRDSIGYKKLGFSFCTSKIGYKLNKNDLKLKFGFYSFDHLNYEKHIDLIKDAYSNFTDNFSLMFLRDDHDWDYIKSDYETVINTFVVASKENDAGYMRGASSEAGFICDEMVGSYECVRALIDYSLNKYGNLKVYLPEAYPIYEYINEPINKINYLPFLCFKILDIKKFCSLISVESSNNVNILIEDGFDTSINGKYAISGGDPVSCRKAIGYKLKMDITTFNQIALGFVSAKEAFSADKIEGDASDIAKLGEIFEKTCNYGFKD